MEEVYNDNYDVCREELDDYMLSLQDPEFREKLKHYMEALAMAGFTEELLADMFTYHAPTPEQQEKYIALRNQFYLTARLVIELVPSGPTQTVVIRKLWEVSMIANGAIATEGKV